MSYIDITGKTTEAAIEKALEQLGMERDDVTVEILEMPKSGFLGLGGTPAKVRVTYGPEESEVIPEAPVKPVKPQQVKKEPAKKEAPKERPARQEKPQPEKAPEIDLPLCEDDNASRITAFLTGLLAQLEHQAQVKVYEVEKGRYKVLLEGQKLGALIGRRGETLDAIQQLTNYAVNSGAEKRIRVQVDAENYRAKREGSLESLAAKTAEKAVRYRRSVTLEPMNAYERHVIHAALQDTPEVTTYSVGTEPNRRVVVAYEK
ncbi:MAG: protein jag [Oscillospiraceae bacterium]|nr:protein jag [Oscillospiraceae bacterium]